MAWDDFAQSRYGAGKNITQAMARILRDHDEAMIGLPFETDVSGNTTNASYTTVGSISVAVPAAAYGFWTLNVQPLVDGQGDIRLQDDTETANGTGVAFNVSSTDLPSAVSLAILSTWTAPVNGARTINIQMQATTGTVSFDLGDRLCLWWSVT